MDPLSIGLGAIGLASKVFGAKKSADANEEAENQLNKQFQENETYFNNNVNRDYLDTNHAKGVVEQLRKNYKDKASTIDSNTAVTGGTAEGNIAAKTALNEKENEAINNVAQQGTYFKQQSERDYRYRLSDLYKQRMALNREKAASAGNLSDIGGELLGTAASVAGLGKGESGSLSGISGQNRVKLNDIAENETNKILN